jgi:hypothetical protein
VCGTAIAESKKPWEGFCGLRSKQKVALQVV